MASIHNTAGFDWNAEITIITVMELSPQVMQYILGGHGSPQTLGHWCPHLSCLAQRSSQGSRLQGAPHGSLHWPCNAQPQTLPRCASPVTSQINTCIAEWSCWYLSTLLAVHSSWYPFNPTLL